MDSGIPGDFFFFNVHSLINNYSIKESLDELEEMVVSRFAHVEDKHIEAPTWPEHPYKEEHFKNKWCVVPIKDIRYLNMTFPLPDMHEHFRSAVS